MKTDASSIHVVPQGHRPARDVVYWEMFQASSDPRQQWMRERPHPFGFAMRGYAVVNYEHNYNPIARTDRYGFYHPYSLDPYNGVASNTAAVRCVRAHAGTWHIHPERIGVWGHSKASYGAVLLGNPNNQELNEWRRFEGFPADSPEPQPWPGVSSAVAASYQSAGDGTQRYRSLIGPDYVPTLTSHGDRDSYIAATYWQEHFYHLEKMDIPHLALVMPGVGHTFPIGFDPDKNLDRYQACFTFFDAQLRPKAAGTPELLYALPPDNATEVCAARPVELRFANRMPPGTVTGPDGIRIVRAEDGRTVAGSWQVSQRGTLFRWQPDVPFQAGTSYRMESPGSVTMPEGSSGECAAVHRFTARANRVEPPAPVDHYR